jgi:hypothetical protein
VRVFGFSGEGVAVAGNGEDGEEVAITPGGPRPRRLVRRVGPGERVRFDEQGVAEVVRRDDAEVRRDADGAERSGHAPPEGESEERDEDV